MSNISTNNLARFTEYEQSTHESLVVGRKGFFFGLDASRIVEIVSKPKFRELPDAPSFIGGSIAVRGQILTVINLVTALFGESPEISYVLENTHGAIVEVDNEQYLILIPEVIGIFSFERTQIRTNLPTIPGLQTDIFIKGISIRRLDEAENEEVVILVDVDRLISFRHSEWIDHGQGRREHSSILSPLPELSEEELNDFELLQDSYLLQQEELRKLQLDDYLILEFKNGFFGIPISYVRLVVSSSSLDEIKESSDPVVGFVEYNDTKVVVLDPSSIILESEPIINSKEYEIVILQHKDKIIAILTIQGKAVTKSSLLEYKNIPENENHTYKELLNTSRKIGHKITEKIGISPLNEDLPPFLVLNVPNLLKELFKYKVVTRVMEKLSGNKNGLKEGKDEPREKENKEKDEKTELE